MNYIGQVNSNKQKYLYFRTEATDANDDATGDSALFPVSSLMGMQPTSDTALTLYFKSMLRGSGNEGAGDSLANLIVANDDSGGTEYLAGSGISACGTISVAAAYAN